MSDPDRKVRVRIAESQPDSHTRVAVITGYVGELAVLTATLTRKFDPDAWFLEVGEATHGALNFDLLRAIQGETAGIAQRLGRRP